MTVIKINNKYYFHFIAVVSIFLCSFIGFSVVLNVIGFIINLGGYSFKEARELTKYLFFCCAIVSPLVLLSMIITKK